MIQNGHAANVCLDGENETMTNVDPFYEYILKSLKKRRKEIKAEENQND